MPKKINKPRHGRVKIIVVGNQHGKAVLFERLQAALEQTMGASVPPWGLLAGRKIGRSFVEEVTESMKWMKHKLEEHTITSVNPGDLVSFDHMGKVLVGVVLENTSKFAKDHKLLAVRGYGDVVYNIPPDAIKSLIAAPTPKEATLSPCAYCGMDIASGCAIQSQDGKRRYCADHFTSEDMLTNDDAWARIDLLDSEKAEIEQRKAAIEQQAKLDGWSTQLTPEPEAPLVHCHICGKRIDPDTAVANGYNGDLCCQDHFSASAEEVEAVTEDQATIADLQDRLALAEQKYLDEKSRRVKHGKRANELHNQNAELQRKNLALNAQKRDAVPPIDLWALLYIARADTTKVDAETIRDFLSAGLIAEGDTFASYHLTGRGKYLVSKYCNVTSMGAPDTEKDNLRREVLKLVGEAAGARLELEEVRARLDEIRNIILARSIRMKLSGDTFAVEMNGLNYGTLIHALDGTGKFAPQS